MPMTKHRSDAEDVLISVRQIVSQELRKADTAAPAAGTLERLLLTPALRVDKVESLPKRPISRQFATRPRREPSALELRIAELERAVSGRKDEFEPDGSELEDLETPTSFVFRHNPVAEEAVSPALTPLASAVDEAAEDMLGVPEIPAGGEMIDPATGPRNDVDSVRVFDSAEIDEEHLREIVAEMVRAELKGALGERITRNVRKLVRREIHQALLTRDLD